MRYILAVLVLVLLAAAPSKADDFSFSFTNTIGTVSGTVTGEILGLTNNTTGAAAQVLIESFPSALDLIGSPPIDATLFTDQLVNSFTESGGLVIAGEFLAESSGGTLAINEPGKNNVGFNVFSIVTASSVNVINDGGLVGANIQPLSSPVPEPSSLLLLGTVLLGLGLLARRRVLA